MKFRQLPAYIPFSMLLLVPGISFIWLGCGLHDPWRAGCLVVLAVLSSTIYCTYRLYMERIHQDMAHIQELNQLNHAIIKSLATAIDAKDRHTCSHIERVQIYAVELGKAVGLKGPELEAVATGALVHDIGKLGIPDHILLKPGKLTPEEFKRIQTHVAIGAEILKPVPFPFPVVDVVLTHHERWDGLGYPRGLRSEEIPIGGRIIAIVDVFDALTSHRSYRRAMTPEEAQQVILEGAGKQFDPYLAELFVRILPEVSRKVQEMEAQARNEKEQANVLDEGRSALVRIGQAAAEMAAACDVAHVLSEQDTVDGVFQVVVARALSLLPIDTAVLYLKAKEEGALVAVSASGKYQDRLRGMAIQVGEGVSGWVAQHEQTKVNVSAALDVARRFGPEDNLELSAATAVPLRHGPDTLGVLAVYTTAYSVFTEHHLHVLNLLAEHAASAIQHFRRIEQHRDLAYMDALTGLSNSRGLFRQLERLLSAAETGDGLRNVFSIVMMDLDHFKEVNDTLGHLCGDELLRHVADALTRASRPNDLCCRYAGDEFVVVLPGATRDVAEQVAQRLRHAVDSIPMVDDQVKIGASVGVASFPADGYDSRTLLSSADQRMYLDKFQRRRGSSREEPALAGVGHS